MGIPLPTERLLLRETEPKDAEACYCLNADTEVIRYTGDPPFGSVEEAARFLADYDDYRLYGFGRWAVVKRADGHLIGWCGLKQHDDGMIDLGFQFFRSEWGKGYATEAALTCLHFGFVTLGMERIIGRAARENKASIRVLQKLGFRFGKKEECNGIPDSNSYLLDREDFLRSHSL